jgi:hypothetical protein
MATETNPLAEMTRMMQEFKVPGLDMAPIIESRRKDMTALVEASEAAQVAMQALVRKQAEIVTEAMRFCRAKEAGVKSKLIFARSEA